MAPAPPLDPAELRNRGRAAVGHELAGAIWTSALEPELLHVLLNAGALSAMAKDGAPRMIAVGDALFGLSNGLRRELIAGAGGDKHPERFLESPIVKLAAALAALAIVALFWIASEQHYQGCVSAAVATTAAPEVEADAKSVQFHRRKQRRRAFGCGCRMLSAP